MDLRVTCTCCMCPVESGIKLLNWIELSWVELSWVELSWVELSWVELSWVELSWVELSWVELSWVELSWVELIELNWIELNWIELNWIELNWIELNWIELNWIEYIVCIRNTSTYLYLMTWQNSVSGADRIPMQLHHQQLICVSHSEPDPTIIIQAIQPFGFLHCLSPLFWISLVIYQDCKTRWFCL